MRLGIFCAGAGFYALLLAGCADISVSRVPASANGAPQVGQLVYNLPRTAMSATVTLTLNKCAVVGDKAVIDIDETIVPVASTEADPGYRYAISYKDASSWMKEINWSLNTYSNGTFQTFNGSINDQAGPIAVAALTAAIKIAGAIALPGVGGLSAKPSGVKNGDNPAGGGAPPAPKVLCKPAVVAALAQLDKANDDLAAAKQKKVTKDYPQAQKDIDITAAQAKVTGARKKGGLVRTAVQRWVPAAGSLDFTVDATGIARNWLDDAVLDHINKQDTEWARKLSALTKKTVLLSLQVDEGTAGTMPASFGEKNDLTLDSPGGIILRQPATATLRICPNVCIAGDGLVDITDDLAPSQRVSLPQLGQLRVYPEHSGLFENASLIISVNADGTISSVASHSQSTAAQGLAGVGTAADAATSAQTGYNSAITSQNAALAAKAQYADTVNKALADCLAQQAAIVKAGLTPASCQ